jgi:hypothetical protein
MQCAHAATRIPNSAAVRNFENVARGADTWSGAVADETDIAQEEQR